METEKIKPPSTYLANMCAYYVRADDSSYSARLPFVAQLGSDLHRTAYNRLSPTPTLCVRVRTVTLFVIAFKSFEIYDFIIL